LTYISRAKPYFGARYSTLSIMANEENDKPGSNDYHAWLDKLCETMKPSIDEVKDSFDVKEKLHKQVKNLQQGNAAFEPL
jgi:hypothetical protein